MKKAPSFVTDAPRREVSTPSTVTRHQPVILATTATATNLTNITQYLNPKASASLDVQLHLSPNAPLKLHTVILNKHVKNLALQTTNVKI
jgi:hypothetical protein